MTAEQILAELKEIAPGIAFMVEMEPDPYFVWDGDIDDPAEDGWEPQTAIVKATAIINGVAVEGFDTLGGHYTHEDHPDGDIGGYLPQMLEQAAEELKEELYNDGRLMTECLAAIHFLRQEMRERYEAQRVNP